LTFQGPIVAINGFTNTVAFGAPDHLLGHDWSLPDESHLSSMTAALRAAIGELSFHATIATAFQTDDITCDFQSEFFPVVHIFQSDRHLVFDVASSRALLRTARETGTRPSMHTF
jgi:hypothetical protein